MSNFLYKLLGLSTGGQYGIAVKRLKDIREEGLAIAQGEDKHTVQNLRFNTDKSFTRFPDSDRGGADRSFYNDLIPVKTTNKYRNHDIANI